MEITARTTDAELKLIAVQRAEAAAVDAGPHCTPFVQSWLEVLRARRDRLRREEK